MNEEPLSVAARALLQAHGRGLSPAHDGAAVLAAVQRRVAASPAGGTMSARRGLLRIVGVSILVAAIAGAAALSLVGTDAPTPSTTAIDATASFAPPERPSQPVAPPVAASAAASAAIVGSQPPAPAPRRIAPTSGSRRGGVRAAEGRDDTLEAELALLERARRDLEAERLPSAAAALAEHARRFPRGQLRSERRATEVLLACARGDADARERARAFLATPGSAGFRQRVSARCAMDPR